jgi:hypothetical protein
MIHDEGCQEVSREKKQDHQAHAVLLPLIAAPWRGQPIRTQADAFFMAVR